MELGLIGLGAMGRNLALQLAERGHRVVASDVWPQARAAAEAAGVAVVGAPRDLPAELAEPRTLLLMVKAGEPVDELIAALAPALRAGDLLIDGGNAHYRDTERRQRALAARRIGFLGVGISGGAEGARRGASIMAGGAEADWRRAAPLLRDAAARFAGIPSAARLGPGGAGHFVKMVHNGIEYALMQAIAEAWDLLRGVNGLAPEAAGEVFAEWSRGRLGGFLIEITADLLRRRDAATGRALVEVVLDVAEQKGTGGWAVEAGIAYGAPVPTIMAAVAQRQLSGRAADRDAWRAAGQEPVGDDEAGEALPPEWLGDALAGSFVAALAQGHGLLAAASAAEGWRLPIGEAFRVWRAGSILRMDLLELFLDGAHEATPLARPAVRRLLAASVPGWRRAVGAAAAHGVPAPALASALAWLDALAQPQLSTALIQAQRDLFGAHGFRRVDRPGVHHLR